MAEGLFAAPAVEGAKTATFHPLPPPDDDEVEALLLTVATRTVRLMKKRGLLDEDAFPLGAHELTLAASLQHRLPFASGQSPPRKRRCAFLEGFSLHANTHVHEHDRQGLELLCRYGARGALSLSRLRRREDGRLSYRMKRAGPDGSTQLLLTPLELTRRLAALVPPPRVHLVHFEGVFAPRATLRPLVVPKPAPQSSSTSPAAPPRVPTPPRKPRIPWAALLLRVFAIDVLSCPCGGQRQLLAFITEVPVVREILDHLQLPSMPLPWASAQAPPQLELGA